MKSAFLPTIFLMVVFCVNTAAAQTADNLFGNLKGNWVIAGSSPEVHEEWRTQGDILIGVGYRIKNGEMTTTESLSLRNSKGSWQYLAAVGTNTDPVVFTSTAVETSGEEVSSTVPYKEVTVTFSNPAHDSPKYIKYNITPGSVKAEIADDAAFTINHQVYNFTRLSR